MVSSTRAYPSRTRRALVLLCAGATTVLGACSDGDPAPAAPPRTGACALIDGATVDTFDQGTLLAVQRELGPDLGLDQNGLILANLGWTSDKARNEPFDRAQAARDLQGLRDAVC